MLFVMELLCGVNSNGSDKTQTVGYWRVITAYKIIREEILAEIVSIPRYHMILLSLVQLEKSI